MAIVISDAGPLIALAKVDSLFIPRDLFSRLRIPEAVWLECRKQAGGFLSKIDTFFGQDRLRPKIAAIFGQNAGRSGGEESGGPEDGFPGLRDALQMVILNLNLKALGCHAAHFAERTSACCRTVCTAAS